MAEPQITTKDIVLELNRKVDGLVGDMAEVKVLAAAVASQTVITSDHESRLRTVEEKLAEDKGEKAFRRWVPSIVATFAAGVWWLPVLIHKKP